MYLFEKKFILNIILIFVEIHKAKSFLIVKKLTSGVQTNDLKSIYILIIYHHISIIIINTTRIFAIKIDAKKESTVLSNKNILRKFNYIL